MPEEKRSSKEIRAALRAKVVARQKERYARLRQVTEHEPEQAEDALTELGDAFGALADSVNALRENLDLTTPTTVTEACVRASARKNYAKAFRALAAENPQELENAINQVYQSLDEVAEGLENFAENMGLDLDAEAQAEQEVAEDIIEEAKKEGESPAEEFAEHAEGEEHEAVQ